MQKLTVCIAALVGVMCGVADCSSAISKTLDEAQVRVVGESHRAPRVGEAGHGVPLRHALEQIVPATYSINLPNAGPWADIPVSWHARVPFVAALREAISAAPDLHADVDVNLHLVTVRSNATGQSVGDNAAGVMKHVRELPPGNGATTLQPAAMQATLVAQPPLLEAVRSEQAASSAPQAAAVSGHASAPAPALSPAPAPAPALAAAPTSVPANPPAVATGTARTTPALAPAATTAGDPSPSVPPAEPVREWHLSVADHTVKTALTRWAKEDGWQLVWNVPIDFGVDADATVTGTFEQALQAVVDALKKSETPIQAVLYKGNKVLRVVAKGAA